MTRTFKQAFDSNQVFIIAEIGINHNGNIEIAKQLMDLAKSSGCDAVKFQKRTIEIVYSKEILDTPRESPWGTTTREQKEGLEFGEAEYNEIDAYSRLIGMPWFASAWDVPSQIFLQKYNLPYNKIASAMITHLELVETVAKEGKTTFVSTGICQMTDIEKAVAVFSKFNCPIVLMHTVSVYPCPEDSLNLKLIDTLKNIFNLPVGYSGHESTVAPSLIAVVKGAVTIERHITLDRAMYGSDQAASLAPRGLQELVSEIRRYPSMLGDGVKRFAPGEELVASKLRYW
jgi:N-acetylneuraminate synthase